MIQSEQVRSLRTEFRENKQHKLAKPSSLVASSEDKTVLFNIAGMQPLVPYLSWKPHKNGKRLYNIQRCLRTNDIDEVWDNTHCTFFEMMWNWSLGDYFKQESLTWSVEFLTEKLGLNFDKLWFTIFGGLTWGATSTGNKSGNLLFDEKAKQILLDMWVDEKNIQLVPMFEWKKCDNFWWPAGKIWPCGPSCEIYYDKGDAFGENDKDFVWNESRYVEIWNNVFMQFYKDDKWDLSLLDHKNIDTGMGFERLMTFLQWKDSVYDTDLFETIIKKVAEQAKIEKIDNSNKHLRIVVEHLRSVVFLLGDGVIPSNEWRWYVARRLLRRMRFHLRKLNENISDNLSKNITDLVESVILKYWDIYSHLKNNQSNIVAVLVKEIEQFEKTLKRGEEMVMKKVKEKEIKESLDCIWKKPIKSCSVLKSKDNKQSEYSKMLKNTTCPQPLRKKSLFLGEFVFKLYDTYGFPIDLTRDLAKENWFEIDENWFDKCMKEAKAKSKQWASKKFTKNIDRASHLEWVNPTEFIGYNDLESDDFKIVKDINIEWQRILIFDKTPFYAESWGQIGDKGVFIDDDWVEVSIVDVKKYDWVFLHFVG